MYNSLQQSPCDIAAKLAGVCTGRSGSFISQFQITALLLVTDFTIDPLDGPGDSYNIPSADQMTKCMCNTVFYSLLAACCACQGARFPKCATISVP